MAWILRNTCNPVVLFRNFCKNRFLTKLPEFLWACVTIALRNGEITFRYSKIFSPDRAQGWLRVGQKLPIFSWPYFLNDCVRNFETLKKLLHPSIGMVCTIVCTSQPAVEYNIINWIYNITEENFHKIVLCFNL